MALDDQLAALLAQNADLFAAYEEWSNGQIMLLAGTVDDPNSFNEVGGKTGALGYYPVVNVSGQTIYVPCLARLRALALGGENAEGFEELVAQVGGKLAAVDTAVAQAGTATTLATTKAGLADEKATLAGQKAAAAQGVVDAAGTILAARDQAAASAAQAQEASQNVRIVYTLADYPPVIVVNENTAVVQFLDGADPELVGRLVNLESGLGSLAPALTPSTQYTLMNLPVSGPYVVNEHGGIVATLSGADAGTAIRLSAVEATVGSLAPALVPSAAYSLIAYGGSIVVNEAGGIVAVLSSSDPDIATRVATAEASLAAVAARADVALTAYGNVKQLAVNETALVELRSRGQSLVQGDNIQLPIVIIGDSIRDPAAYDSMGAWIADQYAVLGDAGFGYTSFVNVTAGVLASARGNARRALVPVTLTGSWTRDYITTNGPDRCGLTSTTVGDTILVAPTIAGAPLSATKLFYTGSGVAGSSLEYSWNGGVTSTPVDLTGSAGTLATINLATGMPASGQWSLRLRNAAGTVKPLGVSFESAQKGVRIHNVSCSSIRAQQVAAADAVSWKAGIAALAPKTAIIALLTNDIAFSRTPAQYKADMLTIITRLREVDPDMDICIIAEWQNAYNFGTVPLFSTLYPSVEQLAREQNAAAIFEQYLAGPDQSKYAFGSARSWMLADNLHPTTAGKRAKTDVYQRLLTPPNVRRP